MPKDQTKVETPEKATFTVTPPKMVVAQIHIRGTAPLVLCKFSAKSREQMRAKQAEGKTAKSRKATEPKQFDQIYEQARHISTAGRDGIPAAAFRAAMISACRLVGLKMTLAKLSLFIIPDAFDRDEGTGLVHITHGEPRVFESIGRNATGGPDIRVRPQWAPGWEAVVTVQWDADQFTPTDVLNLMARVGMQVGVGEGRPDSRDSAGQGWGTFMIMDSKQERA